MKIFPATITTKEQNGLNTTVEVYPVLIQANNTYEATGKAIEMAKNLFPDLRQDQLHACVGNPEVVEPDDALLQKR